MAVGIGVVLLSLGAVLTWATAGAVAGTEFSTIGIVLIVVGALDRAGAVLYAPRRLGQGEVPRVSEPSDESQETLKRT